MSYMFEFLPSRTSHIFYKQSLDCMLRLKDNTGSFKAGLSKG